MTKRVERIERKVIGDNAGIITDALIKAGTYHSIGAGCCACLPNKSAMEPAITIHNA